MLYDLPLASGQVFVWLNGMRITSFSRVVFGSLLVTALCCAGVYVHVNVNYPPEMHDFVLPRAMTATVAVATPIFSIMLWQKYRTNMLQAELQRLVDRDRLTDVATRDKFFQRFAGEHNTRGISLMLDIDHFKSVNDNYGHYAGDEVIRRVASVLKDHCRESDVVSRFGGEEFVMFLQDMDEQQAHTVAERIRRAVADLRVATRSGEISVTISIGGARLVPTSDIHSALQTADDALYSAKRSGRNRVMMEGLKAA